MTIQQLRRGFSLNSSTTKEREEDLVLFREMQKRERRQLMDSPREEEEEDATAASNNNTVSASMSRLFSSTPGKSVGVDDIFSADWDKNDYDWLMTPPGTPSIPTLDQDFLSPGFSLDCSGSVRSLAALRTSRLGNSNSVSSRLEPHASAVRGKLDVQQTSNTVLSVSNGTFTASRRSLSLRSNSVSRSSSSSIHAVARPSTLDSSIVTQHASLSSNPVGRPSSPCARIAAPRLSTSSIGSSVRPSTPSVRATTSSSKRSTSSSRSSTPSTRPSTSSAYQNNPPISLTRSSSTSKASLISTKIAASSRTNSPITRNRTLQLPGFSQEPPPNLRTSLAERSFSNSRGSSVGSRPGGPTTAKNTPAEATDVDRRNRRPIAPTTVKTTLAEETEAIARNRRQSSSPLVTRGRLSSDFRNGDKTVYRNGKLHDGVGLIQVSNATVSKTVEKPSRSRKAGLSVHEEQSNVMGSHVKRNMKSSPTAQDTKLSSSSAQESAGFDRNSSKKSLDVALRHMDIRRSTSSGFRTFMCNVPASSLFSVKSGHGRGRSNGTTGDSPMATSSNASSELSMSIVPDPDGSELGDEAISEKGSKSSTASRPDSVSFLSKEKRISMWLGYADCKDDSVEEMQIFKQGIEGLSGSESPLVSQHEGIVDCDNFMLDMT